MANRTNRTKKAPCQHRAYLAWPGATYGACTACGTLLERRQVGNVAVYIPLCEPVRRAATPAVKPTRQARRLVQGVLFR